MTFFFLSLDSWIGDTILYSQHLCKWINKSYTNRAALVIEFNKLYRDLPSDINPDFKTRDKKFSNSNAIHSIQQIPPHVFDSLYPRH